MESPPLFLASNVSGKQNLDYEEFKISFNDSTRSDKRSNIFTGSFILLFGLVLLVLTQFDIIKSSGATGLQLFLMLLIAILGAFILYWSSYGFRITAFEKKVTDEQFENNLNKLLQNPNVDILEQTDNYYILFIKPSGITAWNEVHILNDKSMIYINSRAIWMTVFDFGSAKSLEIKLAHHLNVSR